MARHIDCTRSAGRLATKLIVGCASTAAVGAMAIACAPQSSAATTATPNIQDSMSRTIAPGLGTADLGGTWTTARPGAFSVANGYATIAPLVPGDAVAASVRALTNTDETFQAEFTLPTLPTSTSGTFVGIQLRTQADGSAYRVKLRVQADGGYSIGFSRINKITETRLGSSTVIPGMLRAGQPFVLQGSVSGIGGDSGGIILQAIAFPKTATSSSAPVSVKDTDPSAISTPGGAGIWAYNSATSIDTPVRVDNLVGTPGASTLGVIAPAVSGPAPIVTTSSSTATAGSLPVGTTQYAIPSGATYVSSTIGSDSAAGTASAPLHTVAQAIAMAKTGSTIVLRGGTYHENVTVPANKSLTIESYPGEAVWFDGSVPVTDWTQNGSVWVHSGWTAQFPSTPGYTDATAAAFNWLNRPTRWRPTRTRPSSTAASSRRSVRCRRSSPAPSTSTTAPITSTSAATPTGTPFAPVTLRPPSTSAHPTPRSAALGVRRYATAVPLIGTVSLNGVNDSIQNVVVDDNASQGLHLGAINATVDHVTATNNGLLGIHANYADNLVISNSIATATTTATSRRHPSQAVSRSPAAGTSRWSTPSPRATTATASGSTSRATTRPPRAMCSPATPGSGCRSSCRRWPPTRTTC